MIIFGHFDTVISAHGSTRTLTMYAYVFRLAWRGSSLGSMSDSSVCSVSALYSTGSEIDPRVGHILFFLKNPTSKYSRMAIEWH